MGLFNALTNRAFVRDTTGRKIYRPVLHISSPRYLPSPAEEAAMRQSVMNFYRYIVLVIFPIVIVLWVGMPFFGGFFWDVLQVNITSSFTRLILSLGVSLVLLMPAFAWIEIRSRRYLEVEAGTVIVDQEPLDQRTTLGGAFVLVGLTLFVGGVGLAMIYLAAAELFSALR